MKLVKLAALIALTAGSMQIGFAQTHSEQKTAFEEIKKELKPLAEEGTMTVTNTSKVATNVTIGTDLNILVQIVPKVPDDENLAWRIVISPTADLMGTEVLSGSDGIHSKAWTFAAKGYLDGQETMNTETIKITKNKAGELISIQITTSGTFRSQRTNNQAQHLDLSSTAIFKAEK